MDFFSLHAELMFSAAGALLTFTIWNVRQGSANNATREKLVETRLYVATEITRVNADMEAIRTRHDSVDRGLTDELRRIGERLANIEGFMAAGKK